MHGLQGYPDENLTIQHRLLVMDLEIRRKSKKRVVYGQPKIKLGVLTSSGVGGEAVGNEGLEE